MKNIFAFLGCTLLFVFARSNANAQFNQALQMHHNAAPFVTVNSDESTGNDVKEINGDVMRVNVWGGTGAGMTWQCDYNTYSFEDGIPIGIGGWAEDADVALVYTEGRWYAFVVYTLGFGVFLDIYEWDEDKFIPYAVEQMIWDNPSDHVNIDCDINGRLAIVWDDVVYNKNIWTMIAEGFDFGPAIDLPSTLYYVQPDVAVFTNDGGDTKVNYTYTNGETVVVAGYEFYELTDIVTVDNILHSESEPDITYKFPRIASPQTVTYAAPENIWAAVVCREGSNGEGNIVSFVDPEGTGNVNTHVYTDGSVSGLMALDDYPNGYPAISYTNPGDGMVIGWMSAYFGSNLFNPDGLLAINCDWKGFYIEGNDPGYMVVNWGNFMNNSREGLLSLAGRDHVLGSNLILSTFHWITWTDVYWKEVAFPSQFWRTDEDVLTQACAYPNPFTDAFSIEIKDAEQLRTLRLTDVLGRDLIHAYGNLSELNNQLQFSTTALPAGIYTIQINTNNDPPQSIKVVKE